MATELNGIFKNVIEIFSVEKVELVELRTFTRREVRLANLFEAVESQNESVLFLLADGLLNF